ncbi:MAG: 2-phospho-L-lactate transferase [Acidimicrobiales bacterium]
MIAALAGGVGAARFLRGLLDVVAPPEVSVIANTGDDLVLHGLCICPDMDTLLYTLAGVANPETGWGLRGESFGVLEALERLGGESWFRLGDGDLATHLFRTQRLAQGSALHQVAAELARAFGLEIRLLPMSDDPVRTRVRLAAGPEVAFQEYFVRLRHDVAVSAVRFEGAASAAPAPGVLDALAEAEIVVVCPSNPLVSIAPIRAVPGIEAALVGRRDSTVAVSPIVAGSALRGPAARLLTELGHEPSVVGVARLYAPVASALVIDPADVDLAPAVEAEGLRAVVVPSVMTSPQRAATLARATLAAARR